MATSTGLEPATSAVTGRHSNQLSYEALRPSEDDIKTILRTPNGIRTRVTALKGQRPRPLDDGGARTAPCYPRWERPSA
jgi:integrase